MVALDAAERSLRPHKQNRKMSSIPTGTELARPFMPAKDFDLSKRFYEALGFEKVLDSEVAIFNAGSGGFILQRYFQEEWGREFHDAAYGRRSRRVVGAHRITGALKAI